MTLKLPGPVAGYFQADASNGEAVARCFVDAGVVKDEGRAYHGQDAIKRWKDDSAAKYDYQCKPLKSELQDGALVVTCRLEGDFPGSPVALRYFFAIEGERIASLEIVP